MKLSDEQLNVLSKYNRSAMVSSALTELQIRRQLQPFTEHKDWCFVSSGKQGCTCGLSDLQAKFKEF